MKTTGMMGLSIGKPLFQNKQVMRFYANYLKEHFDEGFFFLADYPKRHNYAALNPELSEEEVARRIDLQSDSLSRMLRRIEPTIPVYRWKELMDDNYEFNLGALTQSYEHDATLRKDINEFVSAFLLHTPEVDLDFALPRAVPYFLEEMAMLNALPLRYAGDVVEIYPGVNEVQEHLTAGKYDVIVRSSERRTFREVYAPE